MSSDKTNPESEPVFCTNCGAEISADTSFCPDCGTEQSTGEVDQKGPVADSDSGEKEGYRHKLPGISDKNSTRRNVLAGGAYSLVGLVGLGAIAGDPADSEDSGNSGGGGGSDANSDAGGSSDDSNDTGGSSDANSDAGGSGDEETYPDALYYDDSTGLVLEDDVSAEADSIGSLYIRGTVRNEEGQGYEYVQITWSVLDGSGAKIADALANTSGLEEGQSWRYEAVAASADGAESYELQDITAY